MKKRLLSLVMLFCLLVSAVPKSSFAANKVPQETVTYINPLYSEQVEAALESVSVEQVEAPRMPLLSAGPKAGDTANYRETIDEVVVDLRAGLTARQKEIRVYYHTASGPAEIDLNALFQNAVTYTGNPQEGDYLRWQYGMWRAKKGCYYYSTSGDYYYTLTYYFAMIPSDVDITDAAFNVTPYESAWYTTVEQEAGVTDFVAGFSEMVGMVASDTDYQKVKYIYNWICANVDYDYTGTGTLKHTAYAAAINHQAVCQGYALLFYRLALECGIDARVIAGYAGGGDHAWNVVYLGGKAYLLDATWDAGKTDYDYFLRGSDSFPNHRNYVDETVNGYYYDNTYDYTALGVSTEDFALSLEALGLSPGDLDGDEEITVLDLQTLYEYLSGTRSFTDTYTRSVADVNGDGAVNILDYQALYEMVKAQQ